MHRFYIPPDHWADSHLTLDPDESHHASHVLRLKAGDKVVAFDGQGTETTTTITGADNPNAVTLQPLSPNRTKTPPPPAHLVLGQAVPKGKNMDLVVQKATELGAHKIVPLLSTRTVVSLETDDAAKKQAKWQRVAINACKQSGHNWLPEITTPVSTDRFFNSPHATADLTLIASLQPDSQHLKQLLAEYRELHDNQNPTTTLVLIGPEGDFTPSEINLARSHGAQPLSLGPLVLRTETAALYALSTLAHELF